MRGKRSEAKREKLLAAAGEVFVEKGFRDATVAEICARAEANVSAVSYHFGSKEALYQEAWRHSFTQSLKAYPLDGGVGPKAPAEDRLRGHLTSLIRRIADEEYNDFFIAQMELVNPTGLLQEVVRSGIAPLREKTLALVRELLGPAATDHQVHFCEISIVSMCVHPLFMQRIAHRAKGGEMPAVIEDIEDFADQVVKFALAGISALRGAGREA